MAPDSILTVNNRSQQSTLKSFDQETINLIKSTVAKDATDEELRLFLYQCQKTGLDPLARQIYFQKRKNFKTGKETMTILTAIDGYRLIAHRTGSYAGLDSTVFDDEENPKKATVTVYKVVSGMRCAFSATARWDQYYPGDAQGFMWKKMPHLMLEKCAEALALRKAFPNELSGLYTDTEMEQAGQVIEVTHPQIVEPTSQEIPYQALEAAGFTPDLDKPEDAGERVIRYGKKYSGRKFKEFPTHQIKAYVEWIRREGKDKYPDAKNFIEDAEEFLNTEPPSKEVDLPF